MKEAEAIDLSLLVYVDRVLAQRAGELGLYGVGPTGVPLARPKRLVVAGRKGSREIREVDLTGQPHAHPDYFIVALSEGWTLHPVDLAGHVDRRPVLAFKRTMAGDWLAVHRVDPLGHPAQRAWMVLFEIPDHPGTHGLFPIGPLGLPERHAAWQIHEGAETWALHPVDDLGQPLLHPDWILR